MPQNIQETVKVQREEQVFEVPGFFQHKPRADLRSILFPAGVDVREGDLAYDPSSKQFVEILYLSEAALDGEDYLIAAY